ncbi:MAG: hypothetical protein GY940_04465 [bacterium]|nr:hypothetical protein [bacterium]
MKKRLNQSKWSRMICLLLVIPFLMPLNLAAKYKPQVIVEKIGGGLVQGDLIDVSIRDEVLVIKKPGDLAGVKVPVKDIDRVRILGRGNAAKQTLKGLLGGIGIGVLLGVMQGKGDGEGFEELAPIIYGSIFGTVGLFSGFINGVTKPHRYKKFKIKRLQGKKHLAKRIKILTYLKKRAGNK